MLTLSKNHFVFSFHQIYIFNFSFFFSIGDRPPIAGDGAKDVILLPLGRCFSTINHLISKCWAHDAAERPTFVEILKILKVYEDVLYNE